MRRPKIALLSISLATKHIGKDSDCEENQVCTRLSVRVMSKENPWDIFSLCRQYTRFNTRKNFFRIIEQKIYGSWCFFLRNPLINFVIALKNWQVKESTLLSLLFAIAKCGSISYSASKTEHLTKNVQKAENRSITKFSPKKTTEKASNYNQKAVGRRVGNLSNSNGKSGSFG